MIADRSPDEYIEMSMGRLRELKPVVEEWARIFIINHDHLNDSVQVRIFNGRAEVQEKALPK